MSEEVKKTGIVPVSGTDDVIVEDGQPAGHAVCAVGYDDDKANGYYSQQLGRRLGR